MTDSEAMLQEANRRAHRAVRAVQRYREVEHLEIVNPDYQLASNDLWRALDDYEEIEERQQAKPEATR